MNELLRAATAYAARGWPVFPVKGKIPATGRGFKDASTDPTVLAKWWEGGESLGVAIVTGPPSGLVVLDVDPDHRGHESLATLEEMHGSIPDTARVRTGSGGHHFYFSYPQNFQLRNSAGKLGDGLDIRGSGGYVVAPPSRTEKGPYTWEASFNTSGLAELPSWIIESSAKKPKLELARTEGSRNVALTSIAGTLRNVGLDESGIYNALSTMGTGLPDEEIRAIAESVGRYEVGGYPRSEAGQAELFSTLNRGKYLHDGRLWLAWRGHWWDDHRVEPEIYEKAVEAARYRGTVDDKDERKFGLSMESKAHLAAVLDLSAKRLAVDPETLDSDPYLLGVANGVVDLRTGDLVESSGRLLSRHTLHEYRTNEAAPRWESFIQEIFNGDREVINYVWKAVGYSFTGLTGEQCWFLCYGRGANGKSTFLETLRSIAGTYGHTAKVSTFTTQRSRSDADEDVASLKGKRYVISGEAGHTAELDQERIKSLIGTETARARFLYSGSFEFTPVFKLWIANNQRPRVTDDSAGFWRRVRLVPFERQFSPTDDPDLRATLHAESHGILTWCIDGARRYITDGLDVPERIRAVTESYQEENDHFGQFIREACELDPDSRTEAHNLYNTYKRWALESGYTQNRTWPPHLFGRAASTRFDRVRDGERTYYTGVSVRLEEGGNGVGY